MPTNKHAQKVHDGRVALITGAASGLGQAYAVRLAEDGARIIAVDINGAEDTVAQVKKAGADVLALQCDVSDPTSVDEMFNAAREFGDADVLINNAGIYPFAMIDDMKFDEWRKVVSVNLDSMFLLTQGVLPAMRAKNWGRVICMSSGMFHMGSPGAAHYVASKGGVIGFVRALAPELGPSGITINGIAPSLTRTAGTKGPDFGGADLFPMIANMQSIKRTQVPDDISGVVSFLVSDDARFITGQTLVVDGGLART